jgi:hypothetical protein
MRKIISGHGPQREARYQDELVDCPPAARRTPNSNSRKHLCYVYALPWKCDPLSCNGSLLRFHDSNSRPSHHNIIGTAVLTAVITKSTGFWDMSCQLFRRNMSHPSPGSESKLSVPPSFTLVSYLTQKMEAVCYSEALVDFQRTPWCCASDNSTLYDDLVSPLLH